MTTANEEPLCLEIISCASFNGTQQEDSALLRRLLEQRVDGIIIVPRDDFADNDYFRDFVSRRIPVISVDRKTKADIDFIGTDDFYGGYLSARHLYETGRRNLGYLAGPDYASPARLRREFLAMARAWLEEREDEA